MLRHTSTWKHHHVDIETPFLHGDLEETKLRGTTQNDGKITLLCMQVTQENL